MKTNPSEWTLESFSKSLKPAFRTVGKNLFWPALMVFLLAGPAGQWIVASVALSGVLVSLLVGAWTSTPTSNGRRKPL